VRAAPEVGQLLVSRAYMPPAEAAEAAIPYIYHPTTPRSRIDEDLAVRRDWFPKPEAYMSQLQGILAWEAFSRLERITAPTLVIHGDSDRLVPPGNAELIAGRIPNAKLTIIAQASHIYSTDQPDASWEAVRDFLMDGKVLTASPSQQNR